MEVVMIGASHVVDRFSNDRKDCWITWFRREIRLRRENAKFTQGDVGIIMGYSQSYISVLENYNGFWDSHKVRKFAENFGISWEDLVKRVLNCWERGCRSCSRVHTRA
jgi:hypothetical protein